MAIHSQGRTNRFRQSAAWLGLMTGLQTIYRVLFPANLAARVGRSLVATGLVGASLAIATTPTSASSLNSYNIDQCANGGKGTLAACSGSQYQNGDDNGTNSHWAEGDSLPFRVTLSDMTAGTHTIALQYQTVDSGKHSYDYLGSFDATETTSSTATATHANHNNPCGDVISGCNPASPTSTIGIASPDLSGVNGTCGSAGTPPTLGATTGHFSLWGPTGSALTNFAYETPLDQTANSGCVTIVDVTFSVPSDGSTLVLAWSAHIASELVWGAGNGAGAISGAPYHMWVNGLDGSGGAQERSLQSSAIIAQPTLTTVIENGSNAAVTSVPVGTPVHDTATLNGAASTAGGTVTYKLFSNGTCAGTPMTTYAPVTVTNGSVPPSPSFTPTSIGTYSYEAVYSGDVIDATATGACEGPLTVTPLTPGFTTQPASGSITFGGSITDTASVIGSAAGGIPGGSVSFFLCSVPATAATCTGGNQIGSAVPLTPPASGFTSTATSGSVSPAPGAYCFNASYSATANGNYNSVSSETNGANECFTVNKQGSKTATTASGTATFGGGTLTDNVQVSPTSGTGPAPTGTVQFYVCKTASTFCAPGSGTADGSPVHLIVPQTGSTSSVDSPPFAPTSPGTWCFSAVYSGDGNYLGSEDNTTVDNAASSECVSVGKAPSKTTTVVFDAATNQPWTGSETGGASAYDTASVVASPAFDDSPDPTGTISYTFFSNGTCTADTGSSAGGGALKDGSAPNSSTEGPLSQGSYSFQAHYSGDANYLPSTGECEPFALSFPVITATKSSSPKDGSVVHPGDIVTYTITLSNAGLADATGISLSDAVPAGTTYVNGSASDAGALSGSKVVWSGLTVPGSGTKAVTFQVTVNANDTDGQVIPNHAIFPNVNTPQTDCVQSSDTTPQVTATSVQTPSSALCDTNTVTLTVAIPIINVAKSEPTPGDGHTVTAGQSAPITYKLAVTNAGSADATNVVVTDVIPSGSTYVAGSATPSVEASYNSSTKTITWTIPSVPGMSGSTPGEVDLTFQATVDSSDANGSTITNQAAFTDLNTPNCTAGSTTAVCLTNTVSNPVVTPPVVVVTPAPQVAPTTTTTVAKHALAFTGLNAKTLAIVAFGLLGGGILFVLIGRRRRPNN